MDRLRLRKGIIMLLCATADVKKRHPRGERLRGPERITRERCDKRVPFYDILRNYVKEDGPA